MDRQLVVSLVLLAVSLLLCLLLTWKVGADYEKDTGIFMRVMLLFLGYVSGPLLAIVVHDLLSAKGVWEVSVWVLVPAILAWEGLVVLAYNLGKWRNRLASK